MAYVIIADDEVNQVVETKELATKERKDLERMGCEVRVKPFDTMAEAEEWADLIMNLRFD